MEVTYPKSSPILICMVYRPPSSLVEWYDYFEDMRDKAYSEDKEMITICDINLDFFKKHQIPCRWFEIMDTFNLQQIIKEPKRITKTTKSCIDHIYVSMLNTYVHLKCLILEFQIIFQYVM